MKKSQTPNTKHQKTFKLQTPKRTQLEVLEFGFWSFFGVWCLVFGV
jgi:hypothetical protein